jgi:cytochrome P450
LGGRTPTAADLPALRYTEMILKESMRLYPPAWLITRRVHEAVQIGPHAFPPNALLMMSPYVLHHDGRYFVEPERFLPGRWEADLEKRIPRYAYFPFGGGPRICIGNSFAMMEATLILATIAQRFDLSLASAALVDPEPLITLRPKQPILMHAAQRQRAATFA